VIFNQASLRADPAIIRQNRRGQSGLWGYSISGDLPIVLLQISDIAHLDLVRQLVQAHAWWRLKGLPVDLVLWNEERDIYRQRLQEQILGLVSAGVEAHVIDKPGGIFVRHADQIAHEDRVLLQSVARVVFSDKRGTLEEQLQRTARVERRSGGPGGQRAGVERRHTPFVPTRSHRPQTASSVVTQVAPGDLSLFNGLGGFSPDGREYVIAASAANPRRRPGSTWWPIRISAPSSRKPAAATPGARTPTNCA
jgi:cyclic beta-1,2-glucan synthetase